MREEFKKAYENYRILTQYMAPQEAMDYCIFWGNYSLKVATALDNCVGGRTILPALKAAQLSSAARARRRGDYSRARFHLGRNKRLREVFAA